MVKALSTRVISEEPVRATLEEYWKDKIADTWTAVDVQERAYSKGFGVITTNQAIEALQRVFAVADAESGINWSVVDAALEDYVNIKTDESPADSTTKD